MGALFAITVTIIIAGWLWFYVARPILEDYGIIAPESVSNSDPAIMSHTSNDTPDNAPSSLQTRPQTDQTRPTMPLPTKDQMLDTYKTLRKLGMAREDARAMLNAIGLPLDNNLWSKAAPPVEEPQDVTPIAGRPTKAPFREVDPALAYRPLE